MDALHHVLAFCHKKLGLLNKRVAAQSLAPKLKAWGKRQDLALLPLILVAVSVTHAEPVHYPPQIGFSHWLTAADPNKSLHSSYESACKNLGSVYGVGFARLGVEYIYPAGSYTDVSPYLSST
ncbi:MAG: hypothetical protein ACLGH6_02820 [Gammaproteobacteria bacterium]